METRDKKEVQAMIDATLKKSFTDRRLGDTPTDILQLANKGYVDNKTGYSGLVASNVASTPFPTNWSVSKTSAGTYKVTHNLGTTSYAVLAFISGSTLVTIGNVIARNANDFTITWYNQTAATSWTATDTNFFFLVKQ